MPRREEKRSSLDLVMQLLGLVKPMLPVMLLAILMGTIGFLCAIFITVFGGYALLHEVGAKIPFSLSFLFGAVIVFAILRGVLKYAEQASNHYIAFKILAMLRDKVFAKLRCLAPAKLETRDKGNLITVITTDIELMEVFYAHTISPVAIAVIVSGFMTIYMAQYHVVPALVALLGYVVVGVIIPYRVTKYGENEGKAYRKEAGNLSTEMLESLRGLQEITQYGKGADRQCRIQEQTKILEAKQEKMKRCEGYTMAISTMTVMATALLVLFAGLLFYYRGSMSIEGVVICFMSTIGSFGPVVALASLSNNLLLTFAAANRVLDILEELPETKEITTGKEVAFEGLACNNISFSYSKKSSLLLDKFDLELPKNEILGIMGKSGSGKSTLLRLVMRFWDVNRGNVTISETDVREINTAHLRSQQGFVTQETILFSDTIEHNIKIGKLYATQDEVIAASKKASLHKFVQTLPDGYRTLVGELGSTLSGGERQRIGLARAFLHEAPLLLLDEPTANLDSLNESIILKSLQETSQEKAVILVSHKRSTLAVANRIVSMQRRRG